MGYFLGILWNFSEDIRPIDFIGFEHFFTRWVSSLRWQTPIAGQGLEKIFGIYITDLLVFLIVFNCQLRFYLGDYIDKEYFINPKNILRITKGWSKWLSRRFRRNFHSTNEATVQFTPTLSDYTNNYKYQLLVPSLEKLVW